MSANGVMLWILRVALMALAFFVVWLGLPWFLEAVFHIAWPEPVVPLIAVCVALLVGLGHYRYYTGRPVV